MIRIYVDIDNVIADFQTSFRKFLNKKLNRHLKIEDITEFDFWKSYKKIAPKERRPFKELLKRLLLFFRLHSIAAHLEQKTIADEEEQKKLHKQFERQGGYNKLKRIKYSNKGIKILNSFYKVKFITSRPLKTRDDTLAWLKKKIFPIKPDSLIYCENKAFYESDFDIIIEDKWEDAISLMQKNKTVILFDYPWNRKQDERRNLLVHEKIIRVANWKEVINLVNDIAEDFKESISDNKVLEVWKESIKVQMHFNELIMRNRITFTSIIFAAFGAALALQNWGKSIITNIDSHISRFIIIISGAGIFSYFIIDTFYYFQLLLGAVDHAEKMDKKYKYLGLTISITNRIRHGKAIFILIIHYLIILAAFIFVGIITL